MKCAAMPVVLSQTERLAGVHRERHTKQRNNSSVVYLVSDRQREWVVMGQKLPQLSAWINQNVTNNGNAWERVSTTGLWGNCDRVSGRVGGWHKGRWRVKSVELGRASDEFEALRAESAKAVVVADDLKCYAICA